MPRMEVSRKKLVRESDKTPFTAEEELLGTRRARLIETESNRIAEDAKDLCIKYFKGEISKEEAESALHEKVTILLNSVK
jgi:hypothetical protein